MLKIHLILSVQCWHFNKHKIYIWWMQNHYPLEWETNSSWYWSPFLFPQYWKLKEMLATELCLSIWCRTIETQHSIYSSSSCPRLQQQSWKGTWHTPLCEANPVPFFPSHLFTYPQPPILSSRVLALPDARKNDWAFHFHPCYIVHLFISSLP